MHFGDKNHCGFLFFFNKFEKYTYFDPTGYHWIFHNRFWSITSLFLLSYFSVLSVFKFSIEIFSKPKRKQTEISATMNCFQFRHPNQIYFTFICMSSILKTNWIKWLFDSQKQLMSVNLLIHLSSILVFSFHLLFRIPVPVLNCCQFFCKKLFAGFWTQSGFSDPMFLLLWLHRNWLVYTVG